MRVPPDLTAAAVAQLPSGWDYVAQHGVGEVTCSDPAGDPNAASALRKWAEAAGGALVMLDGSPEMRAALDPWGTPPSTLELQRRIIARFDPDRIVNRGRLPGGL